MERDTTSLSVCLIAPSLDGRGGQAVQAAALVRHLRAEGWSVRHVATDAALPQPLAWAAGMRGLRTALRQAALLPALDEAIRNADVVHAFTGSYASFWLTALPALFLARRFRRPVLIHYHSGEAEDHLRKWWYGAVPILRRVDGLVTPSAYLADLFARYGLQATVIPNVVDLNAFTAEAQRRKDSSLRPLRLCGERSSGPRLLCTRNFEPLYNVGCVLRAFACVREALPGATLTLVGSGSEEGRLRALAAGLGLETGGPQPGVRFAGSVAPAEMPACYAEADLFVNASDIDNMPVSILEAFAAGVPVVTTDAGGIPWMVQDGVTGLLVPRDDPSALAAAVLRLAHDPDLARQFSQRARAEVARYTWEAAGPAWHTLYRSLCPPEPGVRCRTPFHQRSPHEIVHRGRQAIRLRVDAIVAALQLSPLGSRLSAKAGVYRLARRLGDAVVGPGAWSLEPGAAFWFTPDERQERAALLAERLPETRARVLAAADAALDGRALLFGHVVASVPGVQALRRSGPHVGKDLLDPDARTPERPNACSWHRDPVSGRVWPRVFWTAIDPLPGNSIGDVKFVWELNRHAHFLSLAQAAVFTGGRGVVSGDPANCRAEPTHPCPCRYSRCEAYGKALASQMSSWVAQNPPGLGVHWASSLEVALRALAWLWALHLASARPGFSAAAGRDGARLLWQSARHIERYLSLYTSPNTHLLGEALALWAIGVACPELPGAGRFRRAGGAHLARALVRQIRPDGGPIEQSASYHRYVLEMGLLALTLGERSGEKWPAEVWDRLEAAAAYAMHLTGPDGLLPHMGDCDGGRTLPFAERDPHDARGWLAVAAVLFGRADMKRVAGAPSEELIWLLGAGGLARWEALPALDAPPGSAVFPETGTVVMKAAGHSLIFDAGPHGFGRAGHGHADALAFDLSIHGERVLVDPGTYQYRSSPLSWRDAFRSAAAHNTVIVDEAEPAEPAGAFAWARRVEGKLTRWVQEAEFEWAEGCHEGYRSLDDPVTARRGLLFCKPAYWVLQDILDGREEHTFDLLFHLALGASSTVMPSGEVHVRTAGARSLWLIPLYREGMHVDVTTGQLSPPQGWVSPRYGERIAAPVVRFRCRVHAPAALYTLLYPGAPFRGSAPCPVPRAHWIEAGRHATTGLGTGDQRFASVPAPGTAPPGGGAIVSTPGFRDLLLFRGEAGGPIEVNGWETDAEAAVIREAPGLAPTIWRVGGSYVRKVAPGA